MNLLSCLLSPFKEGSCWNCRLKATCLAHLLSPQSLPKKICTCTLCGSSQGTMLETLFYLRHFKSKSPTSGYVPSPDDFDIQLLSNHKSKLNVCKAKMQLNMSLTTYLNSTQFHQRMISQRPANTKIQGNALNPNKNNFQDKN